MPEVLALDLSLTSTGFAARDVCGTIPAADLRGSERLAYIADTVLAYVDVLAVDLVAIEGYSYGSAVSRAHSLGELGGAVRLSLHTAGVPWVAVPPATVKKYATGKGNADKMAMVIAARERLGYDGQDEDEADAIWVHAAVMDAAGDPVAKLPKSHREALTDTGSGKRKRTPLTDVVAASLPPTEVPR